MLISDKTICEFTGLDCKRKYECKYLEHRFGATRCDDPEYLQACTDAVHEQELEEREQIIPQYGAREKRN